MENHLFSIGKSTISMAIFNRNVNVYQIHFAGLIPGWGVSKNRLYLPRMVILWSLTNINKHYWGTIKYNIIGLINLPILI